MANQSIQQSLQNALIAAAHAKESYKQFADLIGSNSSYKGMFQEMTSELDQHMGQITTMLEATAQNKLDLK